MLASSLRSAWKIILTFAREQRALEVRRLLLAREGETSLPVVFLHNKLTSLDVCDITMLAALVIYIK